MHVLDAGCGTGSYADAVAPKVGHVRALDVNDGMLAVARHKLADAERAGSVSFT